MALSSRVKNKLIDTINTAFGNIGNVTGMKMPRSDANQAPHAWEYWIACHLASLANKRKERAEQAAVRAGVLIDKEKDPHPAGTRDLIFNGDIVSIVLEVRKAAERVDPDEMIKQLIKLGVDEDMLLSVREAATKPSRPAHVFTAFLVTEEANGK